MDIGECRRNARCRACSPLRAASNSTKGV
jgi:hypothetical protein